MRNVAISLGGFFRGGTKKYERNLRSVQLVSGRFVLFRFFGNFACLLSEKSDALAQVHQDRFKEYVMKTTTKDKSSF